MSSVFPDQRLSEAFGAAMNASCSSIAEIFTGAVSSPRPLHYFKLTSTRHTLPSLLKFVKK